MTNPTAIINRVKQLVGVASTWQSIWTGSEEEIAWGQAPAPTFPTASITPPEYQGGFPDTPFSLPALPVPGATPNGVVAATYAGVQAALSVSPVNTLAAIAYGTPEQVTDVPSVDVSAPPADYPEEALLTLPASAGLSDVDLGTVTIGDRPDIYEAVVDQFVATALTPLTSGLPDPSALPDPYELVASDWEDYTADADLLAELLDAAQNGGLLDLQRLWEPLVQTARYERAKAENKAFSDAAARGFSTPGPGANQALLEVAQGFRAQLEEAARKARDDVNGRALKTAEAALQALIQLEKAHFGLYAGYVERSIKAQNFNVRMAQELLKATVQLFNKKIEALRVILRSYKEYLDAVKQQGQAQLDWYGGIQANLEAYDSAVASYAAQHETAGAVAQLNALGAQLATLPLREFIARLSGIRGNIRIQRQNVEGFQEAVRAYDQGVQFETQAWKAYSDGVRAANSAIDVHTANYRALQSFYGDETTRAQTFGNSVQALVGASEQALSEYGDYSQAQREYLGAVSSVVSADNDKVNAFLQGLGVHASYVSSWNQVEAAKSDAINMMNLANSDLNTRQSTLRAQAAATQAQIDAGWYAAQANAAASQAQSFYGIVDTNMRISAGAGITNSTSDKEQLQYSGKVQRSWAKSKNENTKVTQ